MTSLKSLMAKKSMLMLDTKAMKNLKGGKKSGGVDGHADSKDGRAGGNSNGGGNGDIPDA